MAKNNGRNVNDEIFDGKLYFKKMIKRVLIVFAICLVPLIVFNYFMVDALSMWLMVLVDCVVLLLALFISIIIFKHIDEKNEKKPKKTKEQLRDPFSD